MGTAQNLRNVLTNFLISQESEALLDWVKGDIQSVCMQNKANWFHRQSRLKSDSCDFEIQKHSESWEQKNKVTINKLADLQSSNCIVNVLQNCILVQNTELLSALPTQEKKPRFLSSSYPPGRWHTFRYDFSHAISADAGEFFNRGRAHISSSAVENVPYHQVLDTLHRCVSMSL